jgi:hypothetical protein
MKIVVAHYERQGFFGASRITGRCKKQSQQRARWDAEKSPGQPLMLHADELVKSCITEEWKKSSRSEPETAIQPG